jgi:HEPN domain-containing protein
MQSEERKAELVREWLTITERDLQAAGRLLESPELIAFNAFHCQQAAEWSSRDT